eukprot:scaffold28.g7591.t1
MSLSGKVAVLTGASRGIGAAVACALAKQGAKLSLVAHPWHKDDLEQCAKQAEQCGAQSCETKLVDFSDSHATAQFAEECSKKSPDILINNAGIFGSRKSDDLGPLKGDPDSWERMMKVNALAPMRLIRSVAPKMKEKHALRAFSLSAYETLRGHNIKVVDIAPGNVAQTGMADKSDKLGDQGSILPEDVAEAVLFCFQVSKNCVPEEIVLKAARPNE